MRCLKLNPGNEMLKIRCWKLKSACHFTYSPKTQEEQIFRKSLIISYRVNALQLNFLEILLLSYIVVSQKFKLKIIGAKFLLPMISRNELSVTLSLSPVSHERPVPS